MKNTAFVTLYFFIFQPWIFYFYFRFFDFSIIRFQYFPFPSFNNPYRGYFVPVRDIDVFLAISSAFDIISACKILFGHSYISHFTFRQINSFFVLKPNMSLNHRKLPQYCNLHLLTYFDFFKSFIILDELKGLLLIL